MMKSSKAVFVCLFVLFFPTSLQASGITEYYELEEDQWLFVGGEEFRHLEVSFETTQREVYINNLLVFSESKTDPQNINGLKGVSPSDTLYSHVPMILDYVEEGGRESDAISIYNGKISSLFLWLNGRIDALKDSEIALGQLQRELVEKLESEEYRGCMKEVQVFSDGSLMWQPFSAHGRGIITWVSAENMTSRKSGEDFIDEYIGLLKNVPGEQVLVLGFGMISVQRGTKRVAKVLEQLRAIEKLNNYVPGPYSERRAKVFGFLKGVKNGGLDQD